MKFKLSLLVYMLYIGIVYGLLYHYLIMPVPSNGLIHCIISGIAFALLTYIVTIRILERDYTLKESINTLEKNIVIDVLTGLYNRRAFDNEIMKIQKDKNYSLIFMDIDNFRSFNNEYGHKIGDRVLQQVSQTIKSSIRSNDRAYRYGGEELVILLDNCPKDVAFKIAEKIRININKIDTSPLPSITVSLGVATYPEDGDNILNVVEASDNALLTAKKSGKNTTVMYK